MDDPGLGQRHFLSQSVMGLSYHTTRTHLVKRIFEIDVQGQKCQNGYLAKNSHFAILALLSLSIDFKNHFCQMTSLWVLWKTHYTLFLKKCLWPRLGPSVYLSERINWIISSFPRWISNILFVLGSLDHFGSLGCRIGECPFRHVAILFLGSVTLDKQMLPILIC